jgi:hypothetical protein
MFVKIPLKKTIMTINPFKSAWRMNPNKASVALGAYMLSRFSVSIVPSMGFLAYVDSSFLYNSISFLLILFGSD